MKFGASDESMPTHVLILNDDYRVTVRVVQSAGGRIGWEENNYSWFTFNIDPLTTEWSTIANKRGNIHGVTGVEKL